MPPVVSFSVEMWSQKSVKQNYSSLNISLLQVLLCQGAASMATRNATLLPARFSVACTSSPIPPSVARGGGALSINTSRRGGASSVM